MGFKNRNQEEIPEESELAKPFLVISTEGRNTEPEYFNLIKDRFSSKLVEIDVIQKNSNCSSPECVFNDLEKHLQEKYDFRDVFDSCWLVLDREKSEKQRDKILNIFQKVKEKPAYHIALTNPIFEFWLLLHFQDIKKYDSTKLFLNEKNGRDFITEELAKKLPKKTYIKKRNKFPKEMVTLENIERAVEQEKLFEHQDIEKILDNLGSNIGSLVSKLVDIK
jgi:hypothetical protein